MGGFRSFFIKSKFFQLVVEEGGHYFLLRIFEGQIRYEISFHGQECSTMADV